MFWIGAVYIVFIVLWFYMLCTASLKQAVNYYLISLFEDHHYTWEFRCTITDGQLTRMEHATAVHILYDDRMRVNLYREINQMCSFGLVRGPQCRAPRS